MGQSELSTNHSMPPSQNSDQAFSEREATIKLGTPTDQTTQTAAPSPSGSVATETTVSLLDPSIEHMKSSRTSDERYPEHHSSGSHGIATPALGALYNTPSEVAPLEQPLDSQNNGTEDTSISLPLPSSTNESNSSVIGSVSSPEPGSGLAVQPKEVALPNSVSSITLDRSDSVIGYLSGPPKLEASCKRVGRQFGETPVISIASTEIRVVDGPLNPKKRRGLRNEEVTFGDTARTTHVAIPMDGVWSRGFDPATLKDGDGGNIRHGRIPQRIPQRRHKTTKPAKSFHGNLVIDNKVPSRLLDICPSKTKTEFKSMRYTAATCDPNNFKSEGYTLRQVMYDPPRKTELFIAITMCDESEIQLSRSINGVIKNIRHLITKERSKTWGKEAWKKVVVCIVSDGRQKINPHTLSFIAGMGAYQEGVAKNAANGVRVTAHIYEYTSQISVTPDAKIGPQKDAVPIQIIFCLKERHQRKINSHRWVFNAFGPVLEPNVCVLLDVGTMPGSNSLYHLWKAFDINSSIGGACGELVVSKGKFVSKLWKNPLVAAQNFEYKMGNIFDRSLESVFGYITVLPGGFSAYRYIALQNDSQGEGPLKQYFLGETMQKADVGIFEANMYLAEDRILCWELVAKRGGQWILHYVKSAYAETEVPEEIPELLYQRRRWLNGSLFVTIYSIAKFGKLYGSSHTLVRKLFIHVELVYQVYTLIFGWFSLANYYILFIIFATSLEDASFNIPWIHFVNIYLNYAYFALLIICYVLALGSRPQDSGWGYIIVFLGFTCITLYMTGAATFLIIKGMQDLIQNPIETGSLTSGQLFSALFVENILGELVVTLSAYILASIACFEPWHLITSLFQYFLLTSSYTPVLTIYALCNIHDVSWGTEGDNKVSIDLGVATTSGRSNEVEAIVPTQQKDINAAYEDALYVLAEEPPRLAKRDQITKQADSRLAFRTCVLAVWTMTNGLLAAIIVSYINAGSEEVSTYYQVYVFGSVAILAFIKLLGTVVYMLIRLFTRE